MNNQPKDFLHILPAHDYVAINELSTLDFATYQPQWEYKCSLAAMEHFVRDCTSVWKPVSSITVTFAVSNS